MQNFIFYLIHIINLIIQDFITALKFEIIIDKVIFYLNDEQIQYIKNNTNLFNLIKKYTLK